MQCNSLRKIIFQVAVVLNTRNIGEMICDGIMIWTRGNGVHLGVHQTRCTSGLLMLNTYPEGDASVACWSNIGVLELSVLSGTVACAFKTALIRNKEKRNKVMLTKKKGKPKKKAINLLISLKAGVEMPLNTPLQYIHFIWIK